MNLLPGNIEVQRSLHLPLFPASQLEPVGPSGMESPRQSVPHPPRDRRPRRASTSRCSPWGSQEPRVSGKTLR